MKGNNLHVAVYCHSNLWYLCPLVGKPWCKCIECAVDWRQQWSSALVKDSSKAVLLSLLSLVSHICIYASMLSHSYHDLPTSGCNKMGVTTHYSYVLFTWKVSILLHLVIYRKISTCTVHNTWLFVFRLSTCLLNRWSQNCLQRNIIASSSVRNLGLSRHTLSTRLSPTRWPNLSIRRIISP